MKKNKLVIIISLIIIVAGSLQAQVSNFTNNKLLKNANISLCVKDLQTGKIISAHREHHLTTPASTLKLVTTATALELLGAEYKFATTLEIDGELNGSGTLNGNLYIKGSGDPTLGSTKLGNIHFLEKWIEAIKSLGIKKINGNIIADVTAYDSEGINPKWTWEDIGNYYATGIYGIAYKDNTYQLQLKSGNPGTTPQVIKTIPDIPELSFQLYLKSSTTQKDSAYIYGTPYSNERYIYGAIPANRNTFTIKGDIPRPGLILARDLRWKLTANGIEVSGNASDKVTSKERRKTIFTHYSPTLKEIVKEINIHSNNHYAEQLLRHLSYSKYSIGTTPKSLDIIKNYWKAKGLSIEELVMYDGSGLSPSNAVSANFFVELLGYMQTSKNSDAFFHSLPISGESGTLIHFLDNSRLTGKVSAKSGTIEQVKCYAGYLNDKHKRYVFAIMVNNANGKSYEVTRKIEQFLLAITK